MQALVTATENRLRRSWFEMLAHLLEDNSEDAIAERIRTGAEPLVGVERAAGRLAIGWHGAYIGAGQATARWLDRQMRALEKRAVAKKLPVFDATDPPAAHWAAENRLNLIREITDETRQLVKDILMEGARTGANPLAMAREIRQSIGLTAYQNGIVDNYRRELSSGRYGDALARELSHGQSDRVVRAAQAANRQMTPAQIETAVARYKDNWIDKRARDIARTEGLRVAHQGSDELYRQAIERGDLAPEQLERTWHHAGHGATFAGRGKSKGRGGKSGPRPFHVSMDGQVRAFGEPFVSGIGGLLRYPCDPEASAEETVNCRCVVTTRVLPRKGAAPSDAGGGRPGGGGRAAAEEGGGAVEELEITDEAALEEEMAALEEEQAAAMAEAEQAALEEELGAGAADAGDLAAADELAPELSAADLADLLDVALPTEEETAAGGLTGMSPERLQHQQLQQAQGRLAARRAELDSARAEVSRLELEHSAAEREVAGMMRIGSGGFRIAGETELDETAWLTENRPAPLRPPEPAAPRELAPDPYRAPGEVGNQTIVSDKPAPVGFEAVEYNGELYYRHRITGRSYTPAQFAERSDPSYVLELSGPNAQSVPQYEGFQALETKSRGEDNPVLRYRSAKTGTSYTAADMTDGYMEGSEKVMAVEAEKPGILRRIFSRLWL